MKPAPAKNPNIAARTVNRKDVIGAEFTVGDLEDKPAKKDDADSPEERAKLAAARRSRDLNTVAEQVSGDKFCHINFMWPGCKNAFPFQPKLWNVDRYFPYAEGGPLFVDEPNRLADIESLKLKQEAMKKLGHRYLLCTEGLKFEEALEQLA